LRRQTTTLLIECMTKQAAHRLSLQQCVDNHQLHGLRFGMGVHLRRTRGVMRSSNHVIRPRDGVVERSLQNIIAARLVAARRCHTRLCICARELNSSTMLSYSVCLKQISLSMTCAAVI